MRTPQELVRLREQAVTLRRQGKSLPQIKEILGPMSNATLHNALRGEPPPEWTRRPMAKDEVRAQARELRAKGMDYEEIAASTSVAARTSTARSKAGRPRAWGQTRLGNRITTGGLLRTGEPADTAA